MSFVKFVECFPIHPHMIAFKSLNFNTDFTIAWVCKNPCREGGREGRRAHGLWVDGTCLKESQGAVPEIRRHCFILTRGSPALDLG